MKIVDVSSIQNIPGYVEILKFVLKSQIQNLVEQLQDHAGEETLVLSANLTAGTLSHIESDRGQGFLDAREDIKSQFLTHCLQGKQKYHTAEPPGHGPTGLLKPCTNGTTESGSTESSPTDTNKLIPIGTSDCLQTDADRLSLPDTSRIPQIDSGRSLQSGSTSLYKTHFSRLSYPESSGLSQVTEKRGFPTAASSFSTLDVNRLSHSGNTALTEPRLNNALPFLFPERGKEIHQQAEIGHSDKTLASQQTSSKATVISSILPGPLTNLPTINHSAVKDFISFSLNTNILPQHTQPYQTNMAPGRITDVSQNSIPTPKSTTGSSLGCQVDCQVAGSASLSANLKNCPIQTVLSSGYSICQENILGYKASSGTSLKQERAVSYLNDQQNIKLNHDQEVLAREHNNKTAKRKQKKSSSSKPQLEKDSAVEFPIKKVRKSEPSLSLNSTHMNGHSETVPVSEQDKELTAVNPVSSVVASLTSPVIPTAANFSVLKIQPVVLIDESNESSRKVFIETGTGNPTNTSSKNARSLLSDSDIQLASTCSGQTRQGHGADTKEKDKTKKTLSSKIDEITQRIKKDDAIKQHTVQTSEGDTDVNNVVSLGTPRSGATTVCNHVDSPNAEISRQDMTTPPSAEHLADGDPSKLKDGSRASHRKPKLPRFNIGVASDDEDNADISESPNSFTQEPQTHTSGHMTPFGTPPASVNIGQDDSQDIINIQVGADDCETSFPHINLEELADGLLLTDIPIVSYYNSVEDSGKSLIENVFNLKPGRDPGTKKPLNSQSVIVSGSKLEKDWVKCPLCPDKFLTVEALQYHIKNVNHAIKKYECDLCKRKFSQLRDMERHRRIHTGERPFTCDVCNKSFSRKDNLKSHARKHSLK